jgi:hypothetical protein
MLNIDSSDQRYHRPMSEEPATGPSPAHDASGFARACIDGLSFRATLAAAMAGRAFQASRWLTFQTIAIALMGFGASVAAWFRAAPHFGAKPRLLIGFV